MKKQILMLTVGLFAVFMLIESPAQAKITAGDITGGQHAPHVNIAIFHKLHGQESFVYPKQIKKGNILESLNGKAQFISINHTAGLKDGDVITISNDVLRDSDGSFADFGVDCQLTVHVKGDDVTLAGLCQMLMVDQNNREIEHKGFVKSITMKPGEDWTLIYYDEEDGIAVYADEEVGIE